MRLVYLLLIALMAGTVPAFAGTDSGDAPNPFTEPSAGQTTTSGADGAGTVQTPAPSIVQGSDVSGQTSGQNSEANSSGSFYQQQKKDSESR
jgi:hypothetical protein